MNAELQTALGIALRSPDLAAMMAAESNALSGDITLEFSETTASRAAGSSAWSEQITITAKDSDGNVHKWLNKTFTTRASAGDTSTAGTASVGSTTVTFVNGVAKVTLSGSAAAWLATETATLTIASLTILGYTIAGGTFVVTIA